MTSCGGANGSYLTLLGFLTPGKAISACQGLV